MKKETLNTLKRLSHLNKGIVLRNEKITALTDDKSVCVIYEPETLVEFEQETPIFDINEFLNVIDLLGKDEANIDASEDIIVIKNGRQKTKYLKSQIDYVKEVPETFENTVSSMDRVFSFLLTKDIFETITKMGSLLSLSEVKISNDGEKVSIKIFSKEDENNSHIIELDETAENDFSVTLDLSKLALIGQDDYDVTLLSSGMNVVECKSKSESSLTYYLAPLSE